jgi:hypothetical protein
MYKLKEYELEAFGYLFSTNPQKWLCFIRKEFCIQVCGQLSLFPLKYHYLELWYKQSKTCPFSLPKLKYKSIIPCLEENVFSVSCIHFQNKTECLTHDVKSRHNYTIFIMLKN